MTKYNSVMSSMHGFTCQFLHEIQSVPYLNTGLHAVKKYPTKEWVNSRSAHCWFFMQWLHLVSQKHTLHSISYFSGGIWNYGTITIKILLNKVTLSLLIPKYVDAIVSIKIISDWDETVPHGASIRFAPHQQAPNVSLKKKKSIKAIKTVF